MTILSKIKFMIMFLILFPTIIFARYYDSRTSIWISTDKALGEFLPEDQSGFDTQYDYFYHCSHNATNNLKGMGGVFNPINLNLYSYAHQNPVKFIDPDGNATILGRRVGFDGAIGFVSNDIPLISPGHSVVAYQTNNKMNVIQYGPYGIRRTESANGPYSIKTVGMDDALTAKAIGNVVKTGDFTAEKYNWVTNNCNDFASAIFGEYRKLFIEKEMGNEKGIFSKLKAELSWLSHKSDIKSNSGETIKKYHEYRKFEKDSRSK